MSKPKVSVSQINILWLQRKLNEWYRSKHGESVRKRRIGACGGLAGKQLLW